MFYAGVLTVYNAPSLRSTMRSAVRHLEGLDIHYTFSSVPRSVYQRTDADKEHLTARFRSELTNPHSIGISALWIFAHCEDEQRQGMQMLLRALFNTVFTGYRTVNTITLPGVESRMLDHVLTADMFRSNLQVRLLSVPDVRRFFSARLGDQYTSGDLPAVPIVATPVFDINLSNPTARQRPDWAAVFGRNRNPVQEVPLGEPGIMNVGESIQQARRNRQNAGTIITRAQRADAERRHETAVQQQWRIEWLNTGFWVSPDPDGNPVAWPIGQMEHEHLWKTICWLTDNYIYLFHQYDRCPSDIPVALAAANWLCRQPAFRSLVAEGSRRQLTYPPRIFAFLRSHMRDTFDEQPADESKPWADPRLAHQLRDTSGWGAMPLVDESRAVIAENGRDLRQIDFDDNSTG